jgi:hypothetical protein
MLNFKYVRVIALVAIFAALALSNSAGTRLAVGNSEKPSVAADVEPESVSVSPEPPNATSTFYSVRRDLRRCVSPMCGGYFVKLVNMSSTRCADGRSMSECYVAGIDWRGRPESDSVQILVRGNIVPRRYPRFGNLGELRVSESWTSLGNSRPVGTYYLVRDRGVRCITAPCPTHLEAKLNSSFRRNIAGVNLEGAALGDASAAYAAMTGPDGAIVTGNDAVVTGPGGRSFELKGTQVYVRSKQGNASMKPCIKTGCSSQICSDENVISTCEWRAEYACYQTATCERQSDGNCGFTKTPELTACLGRK